MSTFVFSSPCLPYLMTDFCSDFSNPIYLLDQLRNNDDAAFRWLYVRCQRVCMAYARPRTKLPDDDLSDVLQDTMVTFLVQLRTGKFTYQGVPVEQYIRNLFWKKCVDLWRKYHHERSMSSLQTADHDDPEQSAALALYSDLLAEGTARAEEKEIWLQRVEIALERLEAPCRQLIENFYLARHSSKTVAGMLGLSDGYTRLKRTRCLNALRKQLLNEFALHNDA